MSKLVVGLALSALAFVPNLIAQSNQVYMTEPSFSPDRKEIAFVSGGDIWSVPAEGGIARLLISHPATESRPIFSPDGQFLAFGSNRTGNGSLGKWVRLRSRV